MDVEHLSRRPKNIDPYTWWHEERGGIRVYRQVYSDGRHTRTDKFTIPWRQIRRALERRDRRPDENDS